MIVDIFLSVLIFPILVTIVLFAIVLKLLEVLLFSPLYVIFSSVRYITYGNRNESTNDLIVLQPSLEPWLLHAARSTMKLLPIWLIRKLTYFLRYLVKGAFHRCSKFSMISLNHHVEFITYHSSLKPQEVFGPTHDPTYVIVIHGGGFSLCDCADVSVVERFLPVLDNELNRTHSTVPDVYSIVYDTNRTTSATATLFEEVQCQILKAFDDITVHASGKRLVGFIGDSAGGNLVLSLVMKLQDRGDDLSSARLCLLSPWVDLYSANVAYEENKRDDMLTASWLSRSRSRYVGPSLETAVREAMTNHQLFSVARVLARELREQGVRSVIFDMDQCLVSAHSRGRLRRRDLDAFVARVKPDFIAAANELHNFGFSLAVATHSDQEESAAYGRHASEYIMGEELVGEVLRQSLGQSLAAEFFVVAYNPRVRKNFSAEDAHKRLHVRAIATHFGLTQEQCVLFDDDAANVADTGALFTAYKVSSDCYRRTSI